MDVIEKEVDAQSSGLFVMNKLTLAGWTGLFSSTGPRDVWAFDGWQSVE